MHIVKFYISSHLNSHASNEDVVGEDYFLFGKNNKIKAKELSYCSAVAGLFLFWWNKEVLRLIRAFFHIEINAYTKNTTYLGGDLQSLWLLQYQWSLACQSRAFFSFLFIDRSGDVQKWVIKRHTGKIKNEKNSWSKIFYHW